MPIRPRELKLQAKEALRGARPNAMLMTLIYLLLTTGVSFAVDQFLDDPFVRAAELTQSGLPPMNAMALALAGTGVMALFVVLLVQIYTTVTRFGYRCWCLDTSRRKEGEVSDLIRGFAFPGRVILLELVLILYYLLWYIAVFTPLIFLIILFPSPVQAVILAVAGAAFYLSRILRYAMAPIALADEPEAGMGAAILRSRIMMEGNRKNYFLLELSFVGWFFLSYVLRTAVVLAAGGQGLIASILAGDLTAVESITATPWINGAAQLVTVPLMLWLTPYLGVTESVFYDRIRGEASRYEPANYQWR